MTFSEQVRTAARNSGRTHQALADEVGISRVAITLFLGERKGLRMERLDKLAATVGVRVHAPRKKVLMAELPTPGRYLKVIGPGMPLFPEENSAKPKPRYGPRRHRKRLDSE